MVADILDAVTRKLDALFGEKFAVYTDGVEQGAKFPCFFVSVVDSSRKPQIGGRSFQETEFCIQYLMEEGQGECRELYRVGDVLLDELEFISTVQGDMMHGTDRSYRVEDEILHFFVSYNTFLMHQQEAAEDMKEIEWKGADHIEQKEQ